MVASIIVGTVLLLMKGTRDSGIIICKIIAVDYYDKFGLRILPPRGIKKAIINHISV